MEAMMSTATIKAAADYPVNLSSYSYSDVYGHIVDVYTGRGRNEYAETVSARLQDGVWIMAGSEGR
jgi:hypothetical protein